MKILYKFLMIRLMSTLSDQLLLFAVPLLVYQCTKSLTMSGLAFFIEWMPRIISLPLAGIFSDKFGGQRVYVLADGARASICLLGFIAISVFPDLTFYVVSILMGLCAFFYAQAFIAQETTIPTIVNHEAMTKAQSLVQTTEQTSAVLGPLLAALLSYLLPLNYLLLLSSIIFMVSFLGTFLVNPLADSITESNNKKFKFRDLLEGLIIVGMSKKLIWLSMLTISVNLLWGLSLATGAAMITGFYSESSSQFGCVQAMAGILSIILLFLTPILIQRTSLIFIGIISYGFISLGGFIIGYVPSYYLYLIGYCFILMFDGVFNIYIRTERLKIVPQQHLGKTLGVIVLINQLSVPVSGLLVATYSKTLGIHYLYYALSISAAALILIQIGYQSFQLYKRRWDINNIELIDKAV